MSLIVSLRECSRETKDMDPDLLCNRDDGWGKFSLQKEAQHMQTSIRHPGHASEPGSTMPISFLKDGAIPMDPGLLRNRDEVWQGIWRDGFKRGAI